MDERLVGYRILKRLEPGVLVESLFAEGDLFSQRVVFKVLRASEAQDPAAAQGFRDRALAWRQHRNAGIVRCLNVLDLPDGRPALIAEHVDGVSLAELLEKGPLPPAQARSIARSLCLTLHQLHEEGVVHGALQADKVRVDPAKDRATLVDIGWPLTPPRRLAAAALELGVYASPEFLRGEALDVGADQYALAALIVEMLSGVPPFVAPDLDSLLLLKIAWPTPPQLEDHQELAPVLRRCFAETPAERYRDLAELAAALDAAPPSVPRVALTPTPVAALASESPRVPLPAKAPELREGPDAWEFGGNAAPREQASNGSAAGDEKGARLAAPDEEGDGAIAGGHADATPHLGAVLVAEGADASGPTKEPKGKEVGANAPPAQHRASDEQERLAASVSAIATPPRPQEPLPSVMISPEVFVGAPAGAEDWELPSARPSRGMQVIVALGAAVIVALLFMGGRYLAGGRGAEEAAFVQQLVLADQRIAAGRLSGPGGDEAVDHLLAARGLRPEDPRLTDREEALLETFERLARAASNRGDEAEAAAHRRAALLLKARTPEERP